MKKGKVYHTKLDYGCRNQMVTKEGLSCVWSLVPMSDYDMHCWLNDMRNRTKHCKK